MYNLAKRQGLPKIGDTPDNVGPNTYIFDDYKTFNENFAPFLSNTERKFIIKRKLLTDAIYNVESRRSHIKGGSSIKNKSDRTFFTTSDTPGPADYDPKKITKKAPTPSYLVPPGKGRLYLCTPPPFLQPVPSIPTKIDENGYYVDENGELVKNPADAFDTTLGPAFYDVQINPFFGTNHYKGCKWSKRKAKRKGIDIPNNPGPGEYNIETDIGRLNPEDEYVREMARLYSYVPRTLEANSIKILRENLPGPGEYDTNKTTLKGSKSAGIHPSPFVIGAKRFTYMQSDTPAPNSYNLQNHPKGRRCSLLNVPFGNEAPRTAKNRGSSGPGPAAYNVKGPIEDKLLKKRLCYIETGFNSSAERKIGFVGKDAQFMPSPANYVVEPLEIPQEDLSCCHFKSKTKRFLDAVLSENAEPATYSISETFNKNRNRTSHNTGKVPFQSTQPKCTERISDNPGPADYLGNKLMAGKHMSFSRSSRFKYDDEELPGPATYHIEPMYNDSVYKSFVTYNLRLKENVLRQKLCLPPNKTWDAWYKEHKKKKKLKCFTGFEKRMYDYVGMLFKGINVQ